MRRVLYLFAEAFGEDPVDVAFAKTERQHRVALEAAAFIFMETSDIFGACRIFNGRFSPAEVAARVRDIEAETLKFETL